VESHRTVVGVASIKGDADDAGVLATIVLGYRFVLLVITLHTA
jgi:hypothetical protein